MGKRIHYNHHPVIRKGFILIFVSFNFLNSSKLIYSHVPTLQHRRLCQQHLVRECDADFIVQSAQSQDKICGQHAEDRAARVTVGFTNGLVISLVSWRRGAWLTSTALWGSGTIGGQREREWERCRASSCVWELPLMNGDWIIAVRIEETWRMDSTVHRKNTSWQLVMLVKAWSWSY